MSPDTSIHQLYQSEFAGITAVLCRQFGIDQLALAEDLASEAFLAAAENWPHTGKPANPVAWLYRVAKNKASNFLKREAVFKQKIGRQWGRQQEHIFIEEPLLTERYIRDSQLWLLFAICQEHISVEAQIGLALKLVAGLSTEAIANAFLTTPGTIQKRLSRAKEKLRHSGFSLDLPSPETAIKRLDSVLTTIYLLFNEGCYSESASGPIQLDYCQEAIRLLGLLLESPFSESPPVHALYALTCFHASRLAARQDRSGESILYTDQDETRWNQELISLGAYHLHLAATGNQISTYHLEAAIAFWHTRKQDSLSKWEAILQLYNQLLQISYNPIAALNRTYAYAKVHGYSIAIAEAEKLQLQNNPYYFTLLGELYSISDSGKAKEYYYKALKAAKSLNDQKLILRKLDNLGSYEP